MTPTDRQNLIATIIEAIIELALSGLNLPAIGEGTIAEWIAAFDNPSAQGFALAAVDSARQLDFAGARQWLVQANNVITKTTAMQTIGSK